MESPVVLDKPPEYGNVNNERGFPFDEEESSGAWRQLAARHPDIAARLRARPQAWQRKRRPSGHAADDFGDEFSDFDRFPFDDIPPEFREHFPQHFPRREPPPAPQPPAPPPQQHTSATQTDPGPAPAPLHPHQTLPQYGLRNTVDLGQKSPVDPSVADAEDRGQRSMSAPPDPSPTPASMSRQQPQHQQSPAEPPQQAQEPHSNVRHIPIFVEGRDEPVVNKTPDHGAAHFPEPKSGHHPHPPSHPHPHSDREQYFTDDIPVGFNHPQNFSRAFGAPFHKGFRPGPQPFVQQKVYPQAFARADSPHRSQSPKPSQEEFVKVPVHHESRPDPARAAPAPKQAPQPSQAAPRPPQAAPQPSQAAPQPSQAAPQPSQATPQPVPSPNDPITQILAVQTDVLNLMTEVENFTGSKKDKRYMFLDEMLTRNLIKLDTVETDGKENIRLARKEAIKCIQKCIAVLEAKAEKGSQAAQAAESEQPAQPAQHENGELTKDEQLPADTPPDTQAAPAPDTRPEETPAPAPASAPADGGKTKKVAPKKKRDKSKESQPAPGPAPGSEPQEESNAEVMQVDDKGDKAAPAPAPAPAPQSMDVDGAAASQ